jgi:hypothetical protein
MQSYSRQVKFYKKHDFWNAHMWKIKRVYIRLLPLNDRTYHKKTGIYASAQGLPNAGLDF